jgi:branched-chain amino acid transport system permease protein
MKNQLLTIGKKFAILVKHPFFGFLAAGALLLMVNLLERNGLVEVAVARAFGSTMIYFIISLGFSLLLGYTGLASLGTSAFIGIGAYTAAYFSATLELPLGLALITSLVIAVILGIIVGFISLRIEGMYLAIITLGLAEIINQVFLKADAITGGFSGIGVPSIQFFTFTISHREFYYVIIFTMIVAMIITYNIINSPTGRAMLAIKNSTSAAQAMGISVLKYRLLAFVLSTIYATVGGFLYFGYWLFSEPNSWNLALSINILVIVVIGGSKSIWGVLLGAFVVYGLDYSVYKQIPFFQQYPAASYVFSGLLIILVVMFYPGGIIRLIGDLKKLFIRSFESLKRKVSMAKYGEERKK